MDEVEVESKPGTYPNLDDIVVEDELTLLLPCIVCNKTFKPEVLQRHSKVCEKSVNKKRKTFDSFKQRVKGTDLAEFLPFSSVQKKIPVCDKPPSPKKTSSRWKENHEAFVTAIRAARGEGPDASGGSGDSRSLLRPPDHEQCPYCERHFGRKAFDRHQEWCREQHSRHPPVIASSQAKERLEARIKYRAPPIKSKRAITREKYSPLVQRKVRQVSPSSNFSNSTTGSATSSAGSTRHSSQSQQEQSNRLSKSGNSLSGRSQVKDSSNTLGFNRGMAGRTSLRASQRSVLRPSSPSKRSPASGKLPASPSQRSSLDEPRGVINREDLTIPTSTLKKLQTRNQTTKQHDTKVLESQSVKVQKKHVPVPSLQTMQIEVHSKESKENANNSKSSKNEQLWRQGCHAKHTLFCFPPLNPHSPASSTVTPRSLSKEKEDNRKCTFHAKTNSFKVNNLVTELIVTHYDSQYAQRSGTRCQESSNQSCTNNLVVRGFNSGPPDMGALSESNLESYEVPDIDTGSASSFGFCSSTEVSASSSRSADSNRTYITQSSVCCKTINLKDTNCNDVERPASGAIMKSIRKKTSISEERLLQRKNSFVKFENISVKSELSKQSISKRSLKRATCQELVHACIETSDREKLIPRKRVKVNYSNKKSENMRTGKDSYDISPACPVNSPHLPHYSIEEETQSSSLSNDSYSSSSQSDLSSNACQRSCDCAPRTTWKDIAKNSSHTSHYITFNVHSSSDQVNCCFPLNMLEQSNCNNIQNIEKQCKSGRLMEDALAEDMEKRNWSKLLNHDTGKLKNSGCGLLAYLQRDISNLSIKYVHDEHIKEDIVSTLGTRLLTTRCGISNKVDYSHPIRNPEGVFDQQGKGPFKSNVKPLFPKLNLSQLKNPPHKYPSFASNCQVHKGHSMPIKMNVRTFPVPLSRNPMSVRLQPLPNPFSLGTSGSRQEEPYDPYASAERQMMELLRSDSACNVTKTQKQKSPSPAPSLSPMPSPTLSPKPSPLETSPTSAFTRYAKELESESQIEGDSINQPKVVETDEKYFKNERESVLIRPVINGAVDSSEKSECYGNQQLQANQLSCVTKPKGSVLQNPHSAPQPPPRSNKRLASLTQLKNLDDLVVSGVSVPRPQLQSSHSLDLMVKESNIVNHDINSRPKTYDVHNHSLKESLDEGGWFNSNDSEQPLLGELEFPPILDSSGEPKVDILNLDCVDDRKARRETRESREVREITEQEPGISDIDNLLEEVVRMQHSVSMLSDVDSVNVKECLLPASQSSARSRRNRAGKMHIEDFLFPAELLERENNNFRTSNDSSERSSSVFGSTKSRKSSSKGRRLIEDMLFPPGLDFNANTDIDKEDGDVVVSSNAPSANYSSPMEFNSKIDFTSRYSSSPVALTSKAPCSNDRSDGLPRPKPMSLSTHSSTRNGCNEGNEMDPTSAPTSPMQPSNQSRQSNSSRLSADSAYSSLNRRSPVPQNRRPCPVGVQDVIRHGAESPQSILSQSLTQSLVLSSSGSESSLPPLSVSHSSKRGGRSKHDCDTPSSDIVSATTPLLPKLSKFCHQCGTKFLVTLAKFCHECGAARLEIC